MIRVLIVDDSPTLRQLVRLILESDPELSVVGEARDGLEAIDLVLKLQPDLIILDFQLPRLDGLEVIRRVMAELPRPIIVLTSSLDIQITDVHQQALSAGALMVAPKPKGLPGEDPQADQLITRVKSMAEVKVVRRRWHVQDGAPRHIENSHSRSTHAIHRRPEHDHLSEQPAYSARNIQMIAIGVSTGGPPALQFILSGLPKTFPVPIVIVQHISRGFVTSLAQWLNATIPMECRVAQQNENLQPGVVYLAPDERHLRVVRPNLAWLENSPALDGHIPSVNCLFESVAQNFGPAAVGVLLTGMGEDGAQGLSAMRRAGAYTIAQDEDSCVVFGMPKAAIALGAAVEILALKDIATRLKVMVHSQGVKS